MKSLIFRYDTPERKESSHIVTAIPSLDEKIINDLPLFFESLLFFDQGLYQERSLISAALSLGIPLSTTMYSIIDWLLR